jgi:hypothetical protein
MKQRVEALETAIEHQLGDHASQRLYALLKATSPKIYKDQLLGVKQIIHAVQYGRISADLLERILTAPHLTASQLRDTLDVYQQHPEHLSVGTSDYPDQARSSNAAHYAHLNGQSTGQGESHVVH